MDEAKIEYGYAMNKLVEGKGNLIKALKGDSKTQGNWGELILERVLEKSGLEKGREYEIQANFTKEDGTRVQPDVIIHLPDGKKIIVDAITQYGPVTDNDIEKITGMKGSTARPRRIELLNEGWIKNNGIVIQSNGRRATTWKAR